MSVARAAYDVAVIGGGPAGIAAAASAAESRRGARVVLLDEGFAPGGQIWRSGSTHPPPRRAQRWIHRLARSGAHVKSQCSVVDARRDGAAFRIDCESRGDALFITSLKLVIATGARERFLPFPGWTLPNVMGIGGAQALLKAGASFRGKRVVIAGSGPLLLPVAASLASSGARVLFVAEQSPAWRVAWFAASLWKSPTKLAEAAALRAKFARTRYATGWWVRGATGDSVVRSVSVTNGARERTIECDLLCAGFGLVPNSELPRLLGCDVHDRRVTVDEDQATTVPGVYCAGEPTGVGGVDRSLVEGEIAGLAAMGQPVSARRRLRRAALNSYSEGLSIAFALRDEVCRLATEDTVVCRCEDVRLRNLDPSWTARQAKLYTRAGMGACQGRICGAALECVMRWSPDSVRPPIQPARVATLLDEDDHSTSTNRSVG
jgi:NADPH-dependent 2,4-dienoyl-CoA reductase/sulfur reductase-like enzyme